MGVGALGLVHRGFDTVVKPTLEKPLAESGAYLRTMRQRLPDGSAAGKGHIREAVPLETEKIGNTVLTVPSDAA
jgi:formate dehydrogenase major subunit